MKIENQIKRKVAMRLKQKIYKNVHLYSRRMKVIKKDKILKKFANMDGSGFDQNGDIVIVDDSMVEGDLFFDVKTQ